MSLNKPTQQLAQQQLATGEQGQGSDSPAESPIPGAEWQDDLAPAAGHERLKSERLFEGLGRGNFTLLEVFALLTIAGASLALATYLPVHLFAGVLGFTILVSLGALYWLPAVVQESRVFWLAWWTMSVIYLAAATTAVCRT